MRIYLSGPMTGMPDFNRKMFAKIAATMRLRRHFVYNPGEFDMDRHGWEWSDYLLHCEDILRNGCFELLLLLPGWQGSSGAAREIALADKLGIKIVEWSDKEIRFEMDLRNLNFPLAFAPVFKELQKQAFETAKAHGWHESQFSFSDFISNLHSEASEAWEAWRGGNGKSEHVPFFSGVEEELADIVIRIMDASEALRLQLPEAIVSKMEFNKGRSYRHGGKRA